MSSNNLVLNRFFTQYVFSDLVANHTNNTYCTVVKRYLKDEQDRNNGEVISRIYKYMSKNYRNEYFYQNTILNKLLLGRHSLNTTTALTQIPIGKSKADFIMINGKAVVYEIKTELDSFERLDTQLNDYFKAFNHICVVTSECNFEKISKLLEILCNFQKNQKKIMTNCHMRYYLKFYIKRNLRKYSISTTEVFLLQLKSSIMMNAFVCFQVFQYLFYIQWYWFS